MIYIVSCVSSQNHQDSQGQNLHQLSPRRVSTHPQGSPPAHHLLARFSGPGYPGALAGSGSPTAGQLQGQSSFPPADVPIETLVKKVRRGRSAPADESPTPASATIAVDPQRVTVEEAREAGTVHVGHQVWQQLGLREILQHAGLSERACQLSEAMTLNRLIFPLSE